MDYSFRQFIEQNYMDKLIAAAEEFIECDTRYEIEVTVKCVLIEDIDYSPLKQGKDFVRFPIVLHTSTMALDNGESYRREVFLRGMLSGSFSLRLPALWLYGRTTLERNHGSLSECNLLLAHSTHVPASGIEK